jgi:hypothetical protein
MPAARFLREPYRGLRASLLFQGLQLQITPRILTPTPTFQTMYTYKVLTALRPVASVATLRILLPIHLPRLATRRPIPRAG